VDGTYLRLLRLPGGVGALHMHICVYIFVTVSARVCW